MSGVSRRQFVAGLLGAPASLGAGWLGSTSFGCRAASVPIPDGELLLPGKAAGHRLRDHVAAPGAVVRRERARVAVVGAGASGLCAAWWLARAGVSDVRVLELDEAMGGTAQCGASALTPYPWGAHYIVAPLAHQSSLIELLREMGQLEPSGAVAETALCRELPERIFYRGRWYEGLYPRAGASRDDLAQLERFQAEIGRWAAYRDGSGRRAFALPSSVASDAAEVTALDRESFASWLDGRGLGSSRLRWLADYACRDDYGLLAADTSAWAGISYFASRLREPGAEPQPVVTWPEGNGRLIAHLGQRLGERVQLGCAVSSVQASETGVELIVRSGDGAIGLSAERVIMATPHFMNRRLVAGLEAQLERQPALDRGAWAVANLHLEARPSSRVEDAPLAWDNVFHDSPSLGYVVATHQAGRDHGPTVLTWYYPFTREGLLSRRDLDAATREDWAAAALSDIERAHPGLRAACRRIDVAFWGHGMVRPRVGSVFQPALRAARAPLGRVHFAGSELSGLSLFEEALDHGVRAAEEVIAALGQSS
jgi:protoporphyrinogen oxidase